MKKDELEQFIANNTDKYFSHTKKIINKFGDKTVVYAVFVRKPSIYACGLGVNWLKETAKTLKEDIKIIENFEEGDKVGAGEPLMFIEGSMYFLSELETLLLQKLGIPCLCAWNAYMMSYHLPKVSFLSMIARHCANPDMVYMCEYGVSVGSTAVKKKGAIGFIGCSTDNCKDLFGIKEALGTMPHSLIGYAGSTLKASQMYYEALNPEKMTILVDYFGKEITDTLEVCKNFPELSASGNLSIRLDTHGGRFLEGLSYSKSYEIIENYVKDHDQEYKEKDQLEYLVGMGVSVAAIFYMKEKLVEQGFPKVKIVVSSGFNLNKCILMAKVKAPIDAIGTGSVMPSSWSDTYATADIISYDNKLSVKKNREFLFKKWKKIQSL